MLLRRRSSAIVNPSCNYVKWLKSNVYCNGVHLARSAVGGSSVNEYENN